MRNGYNDVNRPHRDGSDHMETTTMGRVLITAKIENMDDLVQSQGRNH